MATVHKKGLTREVTKKLREMGFKKTVSSPKAMLHVTDDCGNKKDFIVRGADRHIGLNYDDVSIIIDAVFQSMLDILRRGNSIRIIGFGEFEVKYYGSKRFWDIIANEARCSEGKYKYKFNSGTNLKIAQNLLNNDVKDGIIVINNDEDEDESKYFTDSLDIEDDEDIDEESSGVVNGE